MKRKALFLSFLIALAGISGYLLSKASLVGRVGINLFYKEYKFLKVWWQGALLVLVIWIVLFAVQGVVQTKWRATTSKLVHMIAIGLAVIGLYFTYNDFRHTTSHRWLGERFHLGGYLFWIGWMLISLFYLMEKKMGVLESTQPSGAISLSKDSKEAPTNFPR